MTMDDDWDRLGAALTELRQAVWAEMVLALTPLMLVLEHVLRRRRR